MKIGGPATRAMVCIHHSHVRGNPGRFPRQINLDTRFRGYDGTGRVFIFGKVSCAYFRRSIPVIQIVVRRSVRPGGCYGRDSWDWLQSRAGNFGAAAAFDGYLLAPQFAKRTYAGSYEG